MAHETEGRVNEEPIWVRVVAPHFVAGMEFTESVCTQAAPILKWAIGKRARDIGDYFRSKNWQATPMTGICPCLRIGGFGFSASPSAPMLWACSTSHLNAMMGTQMDETEEAARQAAGRLAGEYLDHIQKTDLAAFTPDEFDMLIRTVIEGYREAIGAACVPF